MSGIDDFAKNLMQLNGKASNIKSGLHNSNNVYPAIVVRSDDPLEQNRIVARIVGIDDATGQLKGGRDRDIPDDKLPFCFPLTPTFFHSLPIEGEMVYVILENPDQNTSPRYWVGPIISSKFKLKYQSFKEALKLFEYSNFNLNQQLNSRPDAKKAWPTKADVGLLGRDDAKIILRPREVNISCGIFKKGTFEINIDHPSYISLKQMEFSDSEREENPNLFDHSSLDSMSTVINMHSPRGKYRQDNLARFEINNDLESFGELSKKLHPAVFGDELIKLLDLIIRVLLTHIHTPQNPAVPNQDTKSLQEYSIDGKLQNIISNHVRLN